MAGDEIRIYGMSIVPFNADGSLDEGGLRAHLRYLAAGGVGVYLASYGSGEGQLMRREELRRLYEIGVEELQGKVPVYAAGLGFTETAYVIELAREAAAIGVDAVQIHPPRPGPTGAQKPTPAETEQFFVDVLEAVRTPVLLTNQVAMLGWEVPAALYKKLAERYDQVIGVNTSSFDVNSLIRMVEALRPRAAVHTGIIGQLLLNLSLGGQGALCFEANLVPKLCTSICDAFRAGDLSRALERFTLLLRLSEVLSKYHNPRSLKAALNLLGLPGGHLRRPYLPLDAAAERDLAEALVRLDVRGIEGLA